MVTGDFLLCGDVCLGCCTHDSRRISAARKCPHREKPLTFFPTLPAHLQGQPRSRRACATKGYLLDTRRDVPEAARVSPEVRESFAPRAHSPSAASPGSTRRGASSRAAPARRATAR